VNVPAANAAADSAVLFQAHTRAKLEADLEGTMATMVAEPHLLDLASGTGGEGAQGVRDFYATHLIGQFFPADVEFIPISRTVDGERLVDEMVIRFTHTEPIGHLLPGVPATGRRVEMALVVIVGVQVGKAGYEHIYWDQAGLLAQLGLFDPAGLPVDPTTAS